MNIIFSKVNVFTNTMFRGNPASVCILRQGSLSKDIMQKIAVENETPETIFVFIDRSNIKHRIFFFSSVQEIDICGHGSIAAAHSLRENQIDQNNIICFENMNGDLINITRIGNKYCLTLKIIKAEEEKAPNVIRDNFTSLFYKSYKIPKRSWVLFYKNEEDILNLPYNPESLTHLNERSFVVTAPYEEKGYVLRYFTPKEKIKEDFATGVAQAIIAPLWRNILKKNNFEVRQLSSRGGAMAITLSNDTVNITGEAYTYINGTINTH